ncbi:phytanoyl-CoA dioxygenase family protein [Paraflavitalea sp. CAU 1676]|uniref:phytanoyl-CoA dioxygenase family protein n=1 Tax=Paraflavitalea sp. CAU 1676 TaxID=3032598 RepID=UPI0023DA8B59|nr:phytanoyl-CoA dioxygenase family protein [Paraflavitalea sp. CAU 1676]MDF2189657.1 phytanoyl-CoA dioxygenase family protein [Paraflavitalea sp. CAU 1676]
MISSLTAHMGVGAFLSGIRERGWMHFERCIEPSFLKSLNEGINNAYKTCHSVQVKNGVDVNTDGTVHHLLGQEPVFLEFIQRLELHEHIRAFFNAPYILNSFGGVINLPHKASYVCNIHRDIRTFYNIPMMMNMLVMLDDFTLDNGATWFLTGSNKKDERPEDEYFYQRADRAVGKAGDIILFDSLVWHAAGKNITGNVRRALTLTFSRPFMKQQLDYPRAIGYDRGEEFQEEVRQIIGYNARVPANLDEWYQPPAKRYYRPGQG